jgi:hypothetical protein
MNLHVAAEHTLCTTKRIISCSSRITFVKVRVCETRVRGGRRTASPTDLRFFVLKREQEASKTF